MTQPFRNRVLALLGGDTAARYVPLGRAGCGGKARRQRSCRLACFTPRRNLPAKAAQLVCEYRQRVRAQGCRRGGAVSEPAVKRCGAERGRKTEQRQAPVRRSCPQRG